MSNMVINTNIMALNSHRSTKQVGAMQSKASARLSSGLKINSAADDAAGLAISEKMRAQIRGLDMASKNSQDAISLIQTAEGGMQEVDNMIQRIRELVVQASSDTNEYSAQNSGDRQKIQDEIDELVKEIDSMANRVEFNKKKVINGSFDSSVTTTTTTIDTDWATKQSYLDALQARDDAAAAHQPFQDRIDAAKATYDAAKAALDGLAGAVGYTDALASVNGLITNFDALIDDLKTKVTAAGGATEAANLQKFADYDTGGLLTTEFDTFAHIQAKITDGTYADGADAAAALKAIIEDAITASNDWDAVFAADLTDADGSGLNLGAGDDGTKFTAMMKPFQDLIDSDAWSKAFSDLAAAIDKNDFPEIAAESLAARALTDAEAAGAATKTALTNAESALVTAEAAAKNEQTATTPGKGLYFQVGANANQGWVLEIRSVTTDKLGIGDGNGASTISVLEETGLDITGILDTIDTALSYVTTERSRLGAAQNRLEYTIKSLDVSSENLSAAESRIRDTDMAKEMMTLTKSNVLQQASISMLAQANQAPQNILQLLR